jgi:hypothetical protein
MFQPGANVHLHFEFFLQKTTKQISLLSDLAMLSLLALE